MNNLRLSLYGNFTDRGFDNISWGFFGSVSRNIFCAIIVFLYIFNLELKGFDGVALSYLIFLLVLTLPFRLKSGVWHNYLMHGIFTFLLFVPPFIWAAANSYYYDSDAVILLLLTLKTFIWAWVIAFLVFDLYCHSGSFKQYFLDILKSFVFALSLQSIFIIASFFISGFSELVNTVFVAKGNLTGLEDFRSKGLANSGGANMSMLLSFGVMASIILFNVFRQYRYFIIAVFITIAAAFVGRSGFVSGISIIMLYYFFYGSRVALILLFLLVLCIGFLFPIENFIVIDSNWANWFFLEASVSVSDLISMIENKIDFISLLVGAGFFEDAIGQYERSDSGFVRAIYALGMPLAIYFYWVVLRTLWSGLKMVNFQSIFVKTSFMYFTLVMVVLFLFAFELKESMLYQNMTGRFLFWLTNMMLLFKLKSRNYSA